MRVTGPRFVLVNLEEIEFFPVGIRTLLLLARSIVPIIVNYERFLRSLMERQVEEP
jgi:hypothetical protein